ncbi:CPBP family intramembrane metalloprotease [Taibaiella lutea]|uniref:CPBP family intramembrane metalloprotease n=1 Tax=Taibaiella lutea TaxID=2608001 RepID=A0A5M6CI50_9BACT|nr:CPBP family intramembrane glutamic endopeptidase [Taibaiella lutea]KAA5534888.1 CPBP family intramembrane metalloprotease [Taibaiella lutea]
MFKKYLRIQPAPVQLVIMLAFWSLLFLLGAFAMMRYISIAAGISSEHLDSFMQGDMYNHPNVIFISQAIFQITTFLLPALLYAYLADPQPGAYLGLKKPEKPIQIVLAVFLGIFLIFFVAPLGSWLKDLNLGTASKELDEQREKFINTYLSSGNTLATIRNIMLIAVVPAFCEEFFFRGLLMKFAHSFVPKWWFSIGVSALAFAVFHTSISEFVPIFISGVILGIVYYLTSSIWLSVLLHLVVNGVQALASIYSNPALDKSLENNQTVIILFIIATSLVATTLFFLFKSRTILPRNWSVHIPEGKEGQWDMNNI